MNHRTIDLSSDQTLDFQGTHWARTKQTGVIHTHYPKDQYHVYVEGVLVSTHHTMQEAREALATPTIWSWPLHRLCGALALLMRILGWLRRRVQAAALAIDSRT